MIEYLSDIPVYKSHRQCLGLTLRLPHVDRKVRAHVCRPLPYKAWVLDKFKNHINTSHLNYVDIHTSLCGASSSKLASDLCADLRYSKKVRLHAVCSYTCSQLNKYTCVPWRSWCPILYRFLAASILHPPLLEPVQDFSLTVYCMPVYYS